MDKIERYKTYYYEILEVLKYIPIEDFRKIPPKVIQYLEERCDEKSDFVYNLALPFDKQNISENAKKGLKLIIESYILNTPKNNLGNKK